MATIERIIVGCDHTPAGVAALKWAMNVAAEHNASVEVVHAIDVSERSDLAMERDHVQARRDAGYQSQEWLIDVLGGLDTRMPVRVTTPCGPVADVLATAARGAFMLVIGEPQDRRHTDLPAVLAQMCLCPVITIAAGDPATRPKLSVL
jgi:nucleotide-binding universal stress UspA family protein